MPPRITIWELDEHTLGKHKVLREYLNGWLPILGNSNSRILFIDGFAGPGVYSKGEDGSPIIALKAVAEHPAMRDSRAEIRFLFIEKEPDRIAVLEELIDAIRPTLPPRCFTHTYCSTFDEKMTEVLNLADGPRTALAPAFVMVDPFGVSGTPMSVLHRILQNPKSELYVSLMWDFIRRLMETPEYEPHMDSLYGTGDWRGAIPLESAEAKRKFLFDLFKKRLREGGAKYVLHFDLWKGGRHVYSIFFATKHPKGCDLMKQSIWKVAPWGDYAFRGQRGEQLGFLDDMAQPNTLPLRGELQERFGTGTWVPIGEVFDFMQSDATAFHSGQLKTLTLRPMELEGLLEARREGRRNRGRFPDGTEIRFL